MAKKPAHLQFIQNFQPAPLPIAIKSKTAWCWSTLLLDLVFIFEMALAHLGWKTSYFRKEGLLFQQREKHETVNKLTLRSVFHFLLFSVIAKQ